MCSERGQESRVPGTGDASLTRAHLQQNSIKKTVNFCSPSSQQGMQDKLPITAKA